MLFGLFRAWVGTSLLLMIFCENTSFTRNSSLASLMLENCCLMPLSTCEVRPTSELIEIPDTQSALRSGSPSCRALPLLKLSRCSVGSLRKPRRGQAGPGLENVPFLLGSLFMVGLSVLDAAAKSSRKL